MLAAIAGDIVGSGFERSLFSGRTFRTAFCSGYDVLSPRVNRAGESARDFRFFVRSDTFTDDTVFLVAIMDWLLNGEKLPMLLRRYYADFPHVGWGAFVKKWARSKAGTACGSFGNGAAMRVTPVAHYADTLEQALELAEESARVTHVVHHAVEGTQALAMGVFLARQGETKKKIARAIKRQFRYDLNYPMDAVRPFYAFTSLCSRTVPLAFRAFLEGTDYESVIRRAVSVGGDSDTIASMAGGLAGAYYGVPFKIQQSALLKLPISMRKIVRTFEKKYLTPAPFAKK